MGCILFELAEGKRAFNKDTSTLKYTYEPLTLTFDRIDSQDYIYELVLEMLDIDPSRRPPVPELCRTFSHLYQIEPVDTDIDGETDFDNQGPSGKDLLPIQF